MLGPGARLRTAVLGTRATAGAAWLGDLYLRGGGDPTFGDAGFNRVWDRGQGATVRTLVAQIAGRGIRRVTGQVFGDESLFDAAAAACRASYAMDMPDFGGQLSALAFDHGSAQRPVARRVRRPQLAWTSRAGVKARAAPARVPPRRRPCCWPWSLSPLRR